MIARLRGVVAGSGPDHVIVDCGGVGYLVFCSRRTLERLTRSGGEVTVLVDTQVGEDHIRLFGFADATERDWFRLMTTVQGVGAKVALAVLSVLPPDQLALAIASQDRAALTRADGVGPKLASRILSELKDKAGGIAIGPIAASPGRPASQGSPAGAEPDGAAGIVADAASALVNLGYGRSESFSAVARARGRFSAEPGTGELIAAALKELAS